MVVVVVLDFVVAGVVAVRLTGRVELAGATARVLCVVEVVVVCVVVAAVPLVVVFIAPLSTATALLPADGCSVDEVVVGAVVIDWPGIGNGLLVTEAIN